MAYTIYKNDGTILLTLPEGRVDKLTTSLDLIGKNVNNYGEYYNNNFVKLLTSFAAPAGNSPRSPQIGQLWFDTTNKRLTVYDGNGYKPTYGTIVSGTEPLTTSTGDLWFDSINSQLKIWDGDEYQLVGPPVSSTLGKFGIEPGEIPIREDITNFQMPVSALYSYSHPVALATTASFVMAPDSARRYLNRGTSTQVIVGLTVVDNVDIKGDLYIQGEIRTPFRRLTSNYNLNSFADPADPTVSTSTRVTRDDAINNAIRFDLYKVFPPATNGVMYDTLSLAHDSEVRVLCNRDVLTTSTRLTQAANTGSNILYLNTVSVRQGYVIGGNVNVPIGTTIESVGTGSVTLSTGILDYVSTNTLVTFTTATTEIRRFVLMELIEGEPNWEPYNVYPNTWTNAFSNVAVDHNPYLTSTSTVTASSGNWPTGTGTDVLLHVNSASTFLYNLLSHTTYGQLFQAGTRVIVRETETVPHRNSDWFRGTITNYTSTGMWIRSTATNVQIGSHVPHSSWTIRPV